MLYKVKVEILSPPEFCVVVDADSIEEATELARNQEMWQMHDDADVDEVEFEVVSVSELDE